MCRPKGVLPAAPRPLACRPGAQSRQWPGDRRRPSPPVQVIAARRKPASPPRAAPSPPCGSLCNVQRPDERPFGCLTPRRRPRFHRRDAVLRPVTIAAGGHPGGTNSANQRQLMPSRGRSCPPSGRNDLLLGCTGCIDRATPDQRSAQHRNALPIGKTRAAFAGHPKHRRSRLGQRRRTSAARGHSLPLQHAWSNATFKFAQTRLIRDATLYLNRDPFIRCRSAFRAEHIGPHRRRVFSGG